MASQKTLLVCGFVVTTLAAASTARAQGQEEEQRSSPEPQPTPPQGPTEVKEPAAKAPSAPKTTEPAAEAPKEAAPDKGPDVGYVTVTPAGGFRIRSQDGDYMLRFGLGLGLKYEPVWTGGRPVPNSLLAFVRPVIRGHFFKPWIQYFTSFELAADTPFLLGANILLEPIEELTLRIGQQGTPLSRHTSTGPRDIFFPDYASVPSYFWSGRQRGLTLHGEISEKLEYWAGLYGGSPTREADDPHNYVAEGRLTVHPLGLVNEEELPFTPEGKELPGKFSFTLQGYHGKFNVKKENIDPTNSPLDPTQTPLSQTMSTFGGDLWFQWGRFILNGEYYWRYRTSTDQLSGYTSQGAWGQLVANVYANKIGAGTRFNWINPNSLLAHDNVIELEGQLVWWIQAPGLSLKLRYAYLHQQTPDAEKLASFPTFVLPFTPGPTHLTTLQMTLVY